MGNKSVSQITGIGNICIQTSMGCTLTLKDVRHIPDLRLNLIFVHMLDKDRYNHLEAHQGIIGGGTRQIMLFIVQDIGRQ